MTKHSADIGQRAIVKAQQLVGELRNRRVIRTVGAYIALIWLLSQGFSDLFPVFGLPDWSLRAFIAVSVTAIPLVALLSWKYDVTPTGVVADQRNSPDGPGRRKPHPLAAAAYDQQTIKSGSATAAAAAVSRRTLSPGTPTARSRAICATSWSPSTVPPT